MAASSSSSSSAAAAAAMQAEALPSKSTLNMSELRSRILIGDLPDDFLRISSGTSDAPSSTIRAPANPQGQQIHPVMDAQTLQQYAPVMSPAQHFYSFVPPHTRGRVAIKIVEAKLTKNYGLVRMDPYCRLRVGNTVFETPTSVNGGKAPSWNRTINAYLPDQVESVYLQVFDERAFTTDECVAWAHVLLPEGIFNNEVIDEWYQLSGPQGEGKEGVINLVISFTPLEAPPPAPSSQQQHQHAAVTGNDDEDAMTAAAVSASDAQPLFTEAEVNDLAEMFPSIDKEVIHSVLESQNGNKDSTVTALLEMSN